MRLLSLLICALGLIGRGAPAGAEEARIRVVDVGNGLCVVAKLPGGHSLFYDAGDKGDYCLNAVLDLVPGPKLDLVVLSHSDADHIGELPHILGMPAIPGHKAVPAARSAGLILFPGDRHIPITATIKRELATIEQAETNGATVWNLATKPLPDPDPNQQRVFKLGETTVTIVAGWSDGDLTRHADELALPQAEHNNALSIVIRLEYSGHSILLTGDTVGRLLGSPNTACAYAERKMRDRADRWPIESDVLIGQHHGGNNASSNCFIRSVNPKFVVFSAGHKNYHHPTQKAADRIRTTAHISPYAMLRTDRGDNEGDGEWRYKSIRGCVDKPGDDDVEVILPDTPGAIVSVSYVRDKKGC